mgnify:CR=1 FL=1
MIEQIKSELTTATLRGSAYSSDDAEALQQLKAIEVTEYGEITAGVMGSFLSKNLVYVRLQQLANRTDALYSAEGLDELSKTAIHNSAASTYDRILSGRAFDFADPEIRAGVASFQSIGFFNQEQADALLAKAEIKVKPFATATLRLIKMARGTQAEAKTIEWNRQRYLRITLHEDLPEVVRPYLTKTTNIFVDEPVGRTTTKPMLKAGAYVVDLSRVEDVGTLKIGLDITANVTIEVV